MVGLLWAGFHLPGSVLIQFWSVSQTLGYAVGLVAPPITMTFRREHLRIEYLYYNYSGERHAYPCQQSGGLSSPEDGTLPLRYLFSGLIPS